MGQAIRGKNNPFQWELNEPMNAVREDEYGWSIKRVLYFPGVQSCTAVAVSTKQHHMLFGFHLTAGTNTAQVTELSRQVLEACKNDAIDRLWLVGGLGAFSTSGWAFTHPPGGGMESGIRKLFHLHMLHKVHVHKKKNMNASHDYKLCWTSGEWRWKVHVDPHPSTLKKDPASFTYVDLSQDAFNSESGRW
jgi:hypothetical protein